MNRAIREKARSTPVACEADVCVIGGGCTGTCAAVRAARMSAATVLVEMNGFLGGVATAGLVNIWHSLHDVKQREPIIGGLTAEIIDRLARRDAVQHGESENCAYVLNTEELKIELDTLVSEARVRPFLHARFVAPILSAPGTLEAIVIEDKSGRRAIRAKQFIDATGDGDVIHRMGLPTVKRDDLQPPTCCAWIEGLGSVAKANPTFNLAHEVFNPAYPEALPEGFLWTAQVPASADITMVSGTRVKRADCSDADELTKAEIEGRRQVRAILDILRNHVQGGRAAFLRGLPAYIGIRETRHACCLHTLTEDELLRGVRFEDAIANGTYRVDIHHSDKPGLTFRYLDGGEEYVVPSKPPVQGRWRPPGDDHALFYQIPLRSLLPRGASNVLAVGRLIDADRGAYGAIRVMVNCNQTGEAAGAACALAAARGGAATEVPAAAVRAALCAGGAIIF